MVPTILFNSNEWQWPHLQCWFHSFNTHAFYPAPLNHQRFLFWILAEYRVAWQKRQIGKCSDNKMTLGWWNINRQIVSLFTRRFAVDFCINVVNQIYVKPVRRICCYLVHSKFEYAFNSALRPRYAILPSVTLSSIETVRHLMPS